MISASSVSLILEVLGFRLAYPYQPKLVVGGGLQVPFTGKLATSLVVEHYRLANVLYLYCGNALVWDPEPGITVVEVKDDIDQLGLYTNAPEDPTELYNFLLWIVDWFVSTRHAATSSLSEGREGSVSPVSAQTT